MNATLNSPSQSIETSLLSFSPSSPTFAHPSVHQAPQEVSRSLSPQRDPSSASHEEMDHHHQPAASELNPDTTAALPSSPINDRPRVPADGQDHDRIDVEMEGSSDTPTPPPPRSRSHTPTANDIVIAEMPSAGQAPAAEPAAAPPPRDEEEDSEDESYNEDRSFLEQFQEDTTTPNDAELLQIESIPEFSGLDDEHWETLVHEPLDDPEYIIGESGRIRWTLHGFHGKPGAPNRQRIIRSPVVSVGGYDWNIKLFPRGNDGTDQISVYLECTGPSQAAETSANDTHPYEADSPMSDEEDEEDQPTVSIPATVETKPPVEGEATPNRSSTANLPPWQVAAQIGCVMYNPEEPRVQVFESAAHSFENDNQDWGWVRFHGPWDDIHRRSRYQRQPILRNDTLVFTAYVRIVEDPTRSLWWHPPADQRAWDSVAKTGYRGMIADEPAGNSLVAALAAWFHLAPFRNLVLNTSVPDIVNDPRTRIRPLFEQLQNALYLKHSLEPASFAVSLSEVDLALDYYEYTLDTHTDVIEVWEIIRHLLNKEIYDDSVPNHHATPDVLHQIHTISQTVKPDVTGQSANPSLREPHSVQELVQRALSAGEIAGSNASSVLQIELHRQNFDFKSRKWKKLTHKVKLNEEIIVGKSKYTLFGMIVHEGDLGSGNFYTVLRPAGPGSKWMQYGGSTSGHVTYLTAKQAVESHEGRGMSREGKDAVAYVALYVKSDEIASILPPFNAKSDNKICHPLQRPTPPTTNEAPASTQLPVVVFHSGELKFPILGYVDAWTKDNRGILQLTLPGSATIKDVQKELVSRFNVARIPEQCRLLQLKVGIGGSRWSPDMACLSPQTTLGGVSRRSDGCRLWLHVVPVESIPAPPPPPPNEPATNTQESNEANPARVNLAPTVSVAEDVVMGGTQEPTPAEPPVPEPAQARIFSEVSDMWQQSDDVHFFVKSYDGRSQTITPLGMFLASRQEVILDRLKGLKLLLPDKGYDIHQEMDGCLENIKSNRTFAVERFGNGAILVIEESLSPEEIKAIQSVGDAALASEYYMSLSLMEHFAYKGDRYVDNYFGGPYSDMPLKNGFAFGHCTTVDMNGDAYVGNCTATLKSGAGIMYFANGDTYTGNWETNMPNGEGTMVYAKTGNTYKGGWKNGKRHGKGVMYFEVADEEAQLCKICFEAEMDALFYRCGHVAACEECARQVKDCPVCRQPVDAVVKIFRT